MGAVAARLSRPRRLTSDNPRSEPPEAILDEIRRGITAVARVKEHARDRRTGARRSRARSSWRGPGDVVVIAGKGHETYQVLRDRTVPFDDRQVAREVLARLTPGGPPVSAHGARRSRDVLEATGGTLVHSAPESTSGLRARRASRSTRARSSRARCSSRSAGPRFDGHDFLDAAAERGAQRPSSMDRPAAAAGLPIVRVADTTRALGDLARHVRRRASCPVVAITGSARQDDDEGHDRAPARARAGRC